MNSPSSRWPLAASASLLFALAACQGPDTAPSAPRSDAPSQGKTKVEFSEAFSDSGVFRVISNPDGSLSTAIQARIGSQAEKEMNAAFAQPTLVDAYRFLHGGAADIPDAVALASKQDELRKAASAADTKPLPEAPLAKKASQSDFETRYCRDFYDYSIIWHEVACNWSGYTHDIYTEADSGDRIYAWNNTPYTAHLSLSGQYADDPWHPALNPYWVTWFSWGGSYVNAVVFLYLPSGKLGELGITRHIPMPNVH